MRNSRVHESVWEGVRRAIAEREAVREGWRDIAAGTGQVDDQAARAIARDLAWAGEAIRDA